MISGMLKQSAPGAVFSGGGGGGAAVLVNLYAEGKRITLQPRNLKAVADANLLGRLHELVGPERVRIVAAGVTSAAAATRPLALRERAG
jgi:hypothetical protein